MKQIKTIILLSLMMAMAAKVQAQYTLSYTYDESGNRVQRIAILDVKKMAQNTVNDSITSKDTAVMNTILAEIDRIAETSSGVLQESDSNNTLLESAIINVYPNPASDKVVVSYSSTCPKCVLRIFDIEAKQVLETTGIDTQTEIDVSNLRIGSYFLTITTEDGKSQGWKIVKK